MNGKTDWTHHPKMLNGLCAIKIKKGKQINVPEIRYYRRLKITDSLKECWKSPKIAI